MSQQAKRTNAAIDLSSDLAVSVLNPLPPLCPTRSRGVSRSKDVVKLAEDELHRLVLVNHVHSHVAIVALGAHQGWPEHDADVLGRHSVGVGVVQHPAERGDGHREKDVSVTPSRIFFFF